MVCYRRLPVVSSLELKLKTVPYFLVLSLKHIKEIKLFVTPYFYLFQRLSLPPAIKGRRDILGAAETGSGKTLAFGIPIIHGILNSIETESKGTKG